MNKKHLPALVILLFAFINPIHSQTVRSLLRKANQQYEVGAYTKAIESYQQVIDRRPDETEALSNMADCFRMLNQMEEAANQFAIAMRSGQMEERHLLNFAKTLKALGRYGEAKQYFSMYGQRNPAIGNHYSQTCDFAERQQLVTSEYQVTNERINSTSSDFGPTFMQDQVAFSSARTDVQRSTYNWDGQAKNQLFMARLGLDGYLQPAQFLKGQATARGEGPAAFSPSGDLVAFTLNDFVSGIRQLPSSGNELVLYIADIRPDGSWMNERPFVHNDGKSKTGYPSFSSDGNAMFFASQRDGGYGGYDLYISYREGNNWTQPINLGPQVNSPGDEISPFFDGTNLFFASDYHAGFGGFDIFSAGQQGGQWGRPVNMGKPVNSSRDDYSFIYDNFKNIGYLTSNRPEGRGAEDIYKVSKASGATVMMTVVNASDGAPIPNATLDFSACSTAGGSGKVIQTDNRGVYNFPTPYALDCEVLVTSTGFINKRYPLLSSELAGGKEVNIPLTRQGEEYYGQVVSYSTGQPLENVVITIRNLNSGSTFQEKTDRNGQFVLAMKPNSAYSILYSIAGYQDMNRRVNTPNYQDRDMLGTVSMYPIGFVPEQPDPTPPPSPNPNTNPNPTVMSGYSIQVGAFSREPNLGAFRNLEPAGTIYVKQEGGSYKVRVGVFPTRGEAQQRLSTIKNWGYSGAYVIEESGVTIGNPTVDTGTNLQPPYTPPTSGGGTYKIQLTALRDTRWFDPSSVNHLGVIEDRQKGNLTIKLLSGFTSVSQAEVALTEVKRNGFPTAFVVQEINGQLQRVGN